MTKRFWKILDWLILVVFTAALTVALNVRADNITISNGPGSSNPDYTISTDDVGSGVNVQRMKLVDPTDNGTDPIGVQSNPLWCSIGNTLTVPTSSSTGEAVSVSPGAPFGSIWLQTIQLTNSSTADTLILASTPSTTLYRGDRVTIGTLSFAYPTASVRGEVLSASGTTIVLKNPLPFTPNNTYYARFFRAVDIPVSTTSAAGPVLSTDVSRYVYTDLSNACGGEPCAGAGFQMYGYDPSGSGAERAMRVIATSPSTEPGLVTRNIPSGTQTVSGTVAATQSGTWNIGSITTLPSIPAGNNNIGDVDIVSSVLPSGAATSANQVTHNSYLSSINAYASAIDSQIALLHENDAVNGKGEVWKTGVWDAANGSWRGMESDDQGYTKVVMKPESDTVILNRAITWGTITRTTVSTAATAAAANSSRRALSIWNESGGQIKWTFNGTASSTNYQGILNAGQGLIFEGSTNSTQALSIIAVTGTVTYTISEGT